MTKIIFQKKIPVILNLFQHLMRSRNKFRMKKTIILIFFVVIATSFPLTAFAGILPPCTATGNCGVCDIMLMINAIMRWITIVSSSIAFLWFVLGGFKFITARGRMEKIKESQKIFTNTVIGILIVFIAWTGVNLVITAIADSPKVILYTDGQTQTWYNLCVHQNTEEECINRGDGYPCREAAGHCENSTCIDSVTPCEWLGKQPAYKELGCICQPPTNCGINNYNACDTAPNCLKNLCPGGVGSVCCFVQK